MLYFAPLDQPIRKFENIKNTQRINAVIESGKLYRRLDLDKLLLESEHLAAAR
jgi:hypothetical protein